MAKQSTSSGWDPVLIISQVRHVLLSPRALTNKDQIISLQTLHYLTLAILLPPLLAMFAEPSSLEYEGGAANVGMPILLKSSQRH